MHIVKYKPWTSVAVCRLATDRVPYWPRGWEVLKVYLCLIWLLSVLFLDMWGFENNIKSKKKWYSIESETNKKQIFYHHGSERVKMVKYLKKKCITGVSVATREKCFLSSCWVQVETCQGYRYARGGNTQTQALFCSWRRNRGSGFFSLCPYFLLLTMITIEMCFSWHITAGLRCCSRTNASNRRTAVIPVRRGLGFGNRVVCRKHNEKHTETVACSRGLVRPSAETPGGRHDSSPPLSWRCMTANDKNRRRS